MLGHNTWDVWEAVADESVHQAPPAASAVQLTLLFAHSWLPRAAMPFLQLLLSSPSRGSQLASSISLLVCTSRSYVAQETPMPCCETKLIGRGDAVGVICPFCTQALTGLPGLLLVHPTLTLS